MTSPQQSFSESKSQRGDFVNPMDDIEVRPLRFDYEKIEQQDPVWSRTSPLFSIFINALGIHIPYFERYLVKVMRKAREQIDDPKLLADVRAIIGQEAHHARNFVDFNVFLAQRYPEVEALDKQAKAHFEASFEQDDFRAQVSYVAGYETFTFLAGLIILDGYEEWMTDADPVIRSMWVWHQVEEVEHGAVAFDVYKHFFADQEWNRKWNILKSGLHILTETWKAYRPMCRKEGYFSSFGKRVEAWRFFMSMAYKLVKNVIPVFTKHYHPRQISDDETNPITLAWREKYKRGEDVLDMQSDELLQMSHAS